MVHPKILLEEIVSSVDDALAAEAGGADRFELCCALALGGLTPGLGTLKRIKSETSVPVMFMLRPRQGGMAYTDGEFRAMLEDAEVAADAGADGFVFGLLKEDGNVDTDRCRRLLNLIRSMSRTDLQTVFHRAFDIVPDPKRAIEELVDLGIDRILTSGRAPAAREATREIRDYVELARGRIQVLPGGGIDERDVARIVAETGVGQVHVYLTARREDRTPSNNPDIFFGESGEELDYPVVEMHRVRKVRQILDRVE